MIFSPASLLIKRGNDLIRPQRLEWSEIMVVVDIATKWPLGVEIT